MAHEALQESYPNQGGNPVPLAEVLDIPEQIHGPSERDEQTNFLGKQAMNLVLGVGVSDSMKFKVSQVERFIGNAGYDESASPEEVLSKQAYISSIIENIEMMTRTETAAALKAQNEALRQQFAELKSELALYPAEIMLSVAALLKLPQHIEIDAEEFASEVQDALISTQDLAVPSTAELEAHLALESENTHSPAFGITISKLGHWTVETLRKGWDYVIPPVTGQVAEQEDAEISR